MSNLYLHHNNNNDMNDEEKISLLSAVNDLDSDVEIRQSVKPTYSRSTFFLCLSFITLIGLIFAGNHYLPCSGSGTFSYTPASPSSSVPLVKRHSSCKKGVGYNDASLTKELNICWAYNWASTQDPNSGGLLSANVEFVPILWGSGSVSSWNADATKAIESGSTHLLGFNEPDLSSQSNISPSLAANLWVEYMLPLKSQFPNIHLISPAITNGEIQGMGLNWLQEFVSDCETEVGKGNCQIDAYAMHWYAPCSASEEFKQHFTSAYSILQKPIWITEFICTDGPADQLTFLQNVLPWLETTGFIERYAAFGDFYNNDLANFVDQNGVPNALGQVYAAAPPS